MHRSWCSLSANSRNAQEAMQTTRTTGRTASRRVLRLFASSIVLLAVAVGASGRAPTAAATSGWQWYKVDTHIHSVISADAKPDLGVLAAKGTAAGYNALFLTDHNLGSSFPINSLTANHFVFEDSYTRWTTGTYGSLSSSTDALASSPVHSGSKSLHLAASSSGSGEALVHADRGPNFRSGDIILRVSIYPTRIDVGSGVYVSASIGGDPRVASPVGYTTQGGTTTLGKSTLLVWQLGSARTPSTDPNTRVITYSLGPYTLNTWNTYTINVSQALNDIPSADRPLDYNAVTDLKMAAAANGGTADAYFDTYAIDASSAVAPANEFVYRSSVIHTYDTSNFKLFPSVEMGISKHANRFNFDISDPSQFASYEPGITGIPATQQTGYPAQLNHPGAAGGVSAQEAISTQAEGADFMEIRNADWRTTWDQILQQGVQVLGTGSTDKHTASLSTNSDATWIYAPSLSFDSLIQSLYEGRCFASTAFTGSAAFNLGGTDPYPTRYPVYVPSTQTSANVHLSVPGGLVTGNRVNWIRNGTVIATDTVSGTSYDVTKSISLSGSFTYVRAEILNSSGSMRLASEPIFFRSVTGLPANTSYHVDAVSTLDSHRYTKTMTKGITSSTWAGQQLSLTLDNPSGALVTVRGTSDSVPRAVTVAGTTIPNVGSQAAFDAATDQAWFYDGASHTFGVKAHQGSSPTSVVMDFGTDGTPPTQPTNLQANAVSPIRVDLTWSASTDDSGSVSYQILRDGTQIATSGVASFSDTSVLPNTTYSYTVVAVDPSGNQSTSSDPAQVTTPPDTTPPSAPSQLHTTAVAANEVDLAWTGSSDDVGIDHYDVRRGTSSVGTPTGTTFADLTVQPNTTYTYTVVAYDRAGNASDPSNSVTVTTPAGVTTLTFTPTADAYVRSDQPTANFGSATSIQVDNSPVKNFLLKFTVSGVGGRPVTNAKLRLYCVDPSDRGGDFHAPADPTAAWSEQTVTWNTAPAAAGATIGSLGSVSSGSWYEVSLSSLITGDGTYSLRITSPSSNGADYSSKEGANAPQLVLSLG